MNQEEAQALMAEIGFEFDPENQRLPADTTEQRKKFAALQRLIGAAILDWADEPATDENVNETEEWVQEWLVG